MPLNLSRRQGEKIKIGEDITITITRIANRNANLSIDAPREIRVERMTPEEAEAYRNDH